jgi:hypothetical protein
MRIGVSWPDLASDIDFPLARYRCPAPEDTQRCHGRAHESDQRYRRKLLQNRDVIDKAALVARKRQVS